MWEYVLVHKLRIVVGSIVMLVGFLLLIFLVTTASNGTWRASTASAYSRGTSTSSYDGPNVVTDTLSGVSNGIAGVFQSISKGFGGMGHSMGNAFSHGIGGSVAAVGKAVGGGFAAVGRGVASGAVWVGRGIGSGFAATFRATGMVARASMFNSQAMASVIRPADHTEVPIIEPDSPALLAAAQALPATPAAAPPVTPAPQPVVVPKWPLHGAVTTEFGASDWPYQRVHTGIDISDGTRPGTTPVHPFRPGKVIQVVHSTVSLGNHVIIDHGNGVTSVYAHLASVAVGQGQDVTQDTLVGYEGTTGASTGTHLHFEIRVNGQAANPRTFITGQP